MSNSKTTFSAAEPALGYLYQIRYALLQMFRLPENTTCLIEGDDDIDFSDPEEGRLLASLKHKAPGDLLTDLCPDFWKSVRIWLSYYLKNPDSNPSFFLFTTGSVAANSFLKNFLPNSLWDDNTLASIQTILSKTESKTIDMTKELLKSLPVEKEKDFYKRITIFDQQKRIEDIPKEIMDSMRTERVQFRKPIYQRLEGWWVDECINILTKRREKPLCGIEISEILNGISQQFRDDALPIDFAQAEPKDGVNPDSDERLFVRQLKAIGMKSERLRRAILDYYRAFEQRASWVRENVTLTGEVECYDDRLADEWRRLKEIIWEELQDSSSEEILQSKGKELFNRISTSDHANLRIRAHVTEPYVVMGSYHMLANENMPRVHWHPRFLDKLYEELKEVNK